MTTGPAPGQPAAALPAVPPHGHAGLLVLGTRLAAVVVLDRLLAVGDGLRPTFEPVTDTAMNRARSVEALLRWRHPLFGDVSPVELVPLAEESPLITDIGRWVLGYAFPRPPEAGQPTSGSCRAAASPAVAW